MKCLNCRKCQITLTTEICPQCNVYIPALMRDILKIDTILHNNSYKIEYPLGRGGFGITYQALHINLEEKVAIKEFYPDYVLRNISNNELMVAKTKEEIFQKNVEKFKREGRILAKLRNPNIVQVRDLFEANNTIYLVMELLEGHSLRDELDEQNKGYFTVERAKNIVESLVNALDTIHQAGIYHLDIKPDNIMVTSQGRIVLIDFGSAKQAATGTSRSTGSFTEDYAPPEVMSRRDNVGAESDIFELGMMFYELLTGKRPPKAEDRLRQQFLDGEPPWKAERVPSPWKELIEQAVELKKENRPKSVKEWWKQANNQVKVDNKQNPFVLESKSPPISSKVEVISNPKPILPKSADKFEFETVKVDITGKIIKRIKGKANQCIEDLGNGIKLEMVEIPVDTFLMGSPNSETNRNDDEGPQHQVNLKSFYLGKYQITQEQFQVITGKNPSNFKGSNKLPVEQVTWYDTVEFCKQLSAKTGKNYRLPSEAEWEYACRAGTTTPFAFGQTITPDIVNYNGNYPYGQAIKGQYRAKTTLVGSLGIANAFGLYDMHGNLWEWCQDEWHKSYNGAPIDGNAWDDKHDNKTYHVLRGGSWTSFSNKCRSALRRAYAPINKFNFLGFRVVLDTQNKVNILTPKPVTSPVIEIISNPKPTSKPIDKFEFYTIKVDIKGNFIERKKGQANQYIEDLGNGIKLEMVEIPAGTFLMGTSEKETEQEIIEIKRYWNEKDARKWIAYQTPQHQVNAPTFCIGKYPVTQKQYQAIIGNNPSSFKDDNLPVEQISWHDAVEFCKKLSEKIGKKYRLPSEAEWEYACRAGTTTPFAFGQTITPHIVNYDGNYPYGQAPKGEHRSKTTSVGSLGIANAFGVYDMHGNVWEWCQDIWHDNYKNAPTDGSTWEDDSGNNAYRILRGGSWYGNANDCRSASRDWLAPDSSYGNNGFRVVLDIQNIVNKSIPTPTATHVVEITSNPKPTLPKSTDKFTFETVTVDIKGEIIDRKKGQANQYIEDLGNGITLEMVEIPAGTFLMGTSEQDREKVIAEYTTDLPWKYKQKRDVKI